MSPKEKGVTAQQKMQEIQNNPDMPEGLKKIKLGTLGKEPPPN